MKAFIVSDGPADYEDTNWGVVWAKTVFVARKKFANQHGSDYRDVTARHEPTLDQYTDETLPASKLVDLDWQFDCVGCGMKLDSFTELDGGYAPEEDQFGPPRPLEICGNWRMPFCSEYCRSDYERRKAARLQAQDKIYDEMFSHIRQVVSFVKIRGSKIYCNDFGQLRYAEVYVTFPHSTHGAFFRKDEDAGKVRFFCSDYDYPVWRSCCAWERQRKFMF